jgi:predicted AAA+ superfamily ATPase
MLENFVAQELFAVTNRNLISWRQGTSELEFLVTNGKDIIPLEVKSAKRNRRTKSLDSYIARYLPVKAIKLTRQNFIKENERGITTIPAYCSYKIL